EGRLGDAGPCEVEAKGDGQNVGEQDGKNVARHKENPGSVSIQLHSLDAPRRERRTGRGTFTCFPSSRNEPYIPSYQRIVNKNPRTARVFRGASAGHTSVRRGAIRRERARGRWRSSSAPRPGRRSRWPGRRTPGSSSVFSGGRSRGRTPPSVPPERSRSALLRPGKGCWRDRSDPAAPPAPVAALPCSARHSGAPRGGARPGTFPPGERSTAAAARPAWRRARSDRAA